MLLNNVNIKIDKITNQLLEQSEIELSVLRLDQIHPIISGNKLFKLHYFLRDLSTATNKKIITFGGAYSNHLVATAYACKLNNVTCVGIVRGEKPKKISATLQNCLDFGMELSFISRKEYDEKESLFFQQKLIHQFGEAIIIPEGGYSIDGANGAALIMQFIDDSNTHICCALGTGTTVAGLLSATKSGQQIVAVPVLKGLNDINKRISFLLKDKMPLGALHILDEYHFGGYAKCTPQLILFMNEIYQQFKLPTDFVYTAKMFFAIFDAIKKGVFPKKSKIVCIHTGGLQGNLSLPMNTLLFG